MAPLFQRIAELILKNLRDELSAEEQEELQAWVNESAENRDMFKHLSDEDSLMRTLQEFYASDENVWNKIERAIDEEPVVPVRRIRPWRYVAAASVTILLAAGITWWFTNNKSNDLIAKTTPIPSTVTLDKIVAPTGHHSTLTLADGTVIVIDSSKNGTLAVQGNASIIKKEGLLEYSVSSTPTNNIALAVNTLSTNRGGQQSMTLPDGSYVLLNAESSITYPIAFSGARKVQVKGEAYFEIKALWNEGGKGKLPFIVEILSNDGLKKSEVEVLGTHFSINAYDNESMVRTTLLEGKVRMSNSDNNNAQSAILQPGEQAQLAGNGKISIINDEKTLSAATAWTRNEFFFNNATVADILREASRWYSISFSIPAGIFSEKYGGTISRNVKLATLLEIFKESGIKFKLEGNKLIVTP